MGQIIDIAAATETEVTESPFLVANPLRLIPTVANQVVYGVNLAGRDARLGNYQRWEADGVKTTWTADEVVNLANADVATVTAANILRVVAKVNGVVLHRVDVLATPGAGEFKVQDNAGTNEIVFGDTYAAGTLIEVFLAPAAGETNAPVQITPATSVAALHYQVPSYQMVYGAEAFQIDRLTR